MKLLIDNDPGFEVTLRTEDGRATVKIPIRKGGFENDAAALLAAARFRASHEVVESGKNLLAALEDFHISVEDYPWMSEAFERFRAALVLADNTKETLPI